MTPTHLDHGAVCHDDEDPVLARPGLDKLLAAPAGGQHLLLLGRQVVHRVRGILAGAPHLLLGHLRDQGCRGVPVLPDHLGMPAAGAFSRRPSKGCYARSLPLKGPTYRFIFCREEKRFPSLNSLLSSFLLLSPHSKSLSNPPQKGERSPSSSDGKEELGESSLLSGCSSAFKARSKTSIRL